MSTKELRIKYNNDWPKRFFFPQEKEFQQKLEEYQTNGFAIAQLSCSDDRDFQKYLSYLLDAVDMLPYRPDFAFDNIWKALDLEFFIHQSKTKDDKNRFDIFVDNIMNDINIASSFIKYLKIIPYQTCEYAAKRIIEVSLETDQHQKTLFKRAKQSLGEVFITAFVGKYPPSSNNKPIAKDQRNAGRLLKKIFNRDEIKLNGVKYIFSEKDLVKFLLSVVLANSRNERFHGVVFPPFRSSRSSLDTYAHAYFLFHLSYAILLDVFFYNKYNVIDLKNISDTIEKNICIFSQVFDQKF